MSRPKKTAVATAGILAAVGAMVTTAQPAAAADGYLWVFEHPGFGGGHNYFYNEFTNLQYIKYTYGGGAPMNDSISAINNESDRYWCFYRDANFSDYMFDVEPHTTVSYAGDWADNKISSFMPVDRGWQCPGSG